MADNKKKEDDKAPLEWLKKKLGIEQKDSINKSEQKQLKELDKGPFDKSSSKQASDAAGLASIRGVQESEQKKNKSARRRKEYGA